MHLAFHGCAALALGTVAITATSIPALPAHGIDTVLPAMATKSPGTDNISRRESDLVERQNEHIIIRGCPDMFNQPPLSCSSYGGKPDAMLENAKIGIPQDGYANEFLDHNQTALA